MTKNELRRKIREQLSELSEQERSAANSSIAAHLTQLPEWRPAEVVLGYLAMPQEASVDAVLRQALSEGKRVAVPAVSGDGLIFREVPSFRDSVVRGAYGIREPAESYPALEVEALPQSIMLVPGLGFDHNGGRLGRGGGYYDRVLNALPAHTSSAAVAFSCQLQETLPTESHDARVKLLITESGVYRF